MQQGSIQHGQVFLQDSSTPLLDEEALYMLLNNSIRLDVSAETLYSLFYSKYSRFPLKFKVYEYFKSKGFVVKGGTNYGLDYTVYRASPKLCHSEVCAYVIDGTAPRKGTENDPDNGALSWLELTTLTRVMPDVMKTLLLCYVVPSHFKSREHSYVDIEVLSETIDLSSMESLKALCVRPVTATVRRQPALSELTAGENYDRHKKASLLASPRLDIVPKKGKERRNVNEVRDKKGSAQREKVWRDLKNDRGIVDGNGARASSLAGFLTGAYLRLRSWFTGDAKRKREEETEELKPQQKRRRVNK